GHTRPFAKRSFATKSSIFKDFTKAGLKSIVLRLSCSATVNLPIISNASLIVGISNYLLRWYCFLLLLYAISRQKSTICCDRAFEKNLTKNFSLSLSNPSAGFWASVSQKTPAPLSAVRVMSCGATRKKGVLFMEQIKLGIIGV